MSRLSFDGVDVLIYDPVPANRTATRAAMYALGFRKTETVSTIADFIESVQKSPPDIALCEAQGQANDLCAAIQQVRQGQTGDNPFIAIIVTAWEKSAALIGKVVSSGADDLLLRPFSTATLGQRIETLVDRRKNFVITSDYVGPDRRKGNDGRTNSAPLFEPPNSLKMKARDKLTSDAVTRQLEGELRTAREMLTAEKLRRDAFQICILWRLMQEAARVAGQELPDIVKLQLLTRSIAQRSLESEFHDAVDWCQQILAAAEGLLLDVDRNASMHLLGHAALSLHQVFHPDKGTGEQLSEIDATVTLIRARNQVAAMAVAG